MTLPTAPYGPLSVERHAALKAAGLDLHVFVRGEDVTARCRFADDTPGEEYAELYRLSAAGQKQIDADDQPVMEIVRGEVVIRPC